MHRAALVLHRVLSHFGLGDRTRRIVTFAAVGGTAAATHFGFALAASAALGAAPLLANVVGYGAAVVLSYLGHAFLTFQRPVADGPQFLRFLMISLAGLALSQTLTFVSVTLLDLPFVLALVLVVTVVPVFTYAASSLWGFAARTRNHVGRATISRH